MKSTSFVLRGYQEDIKRRVVDAWERNRSVLVQMPTGTGKTVVLASIVNDHLRINGEESDRRVWIVAHRRELVGQIRETVRRFTMHDGRRVVHERSAQGCAVEDVNGGGITSDEDREPGDAPVRVYSIQWLSRHYGEITERPGLVVIDEAHHALAETYKELWRRCPEAKFLGMTATPCRLNGKGFTDLFDVLVASDGVAEFVRRGWLSAFDYVSIRPESEDQGLVDMLKKRGADGDYQVKEMNAVLNCKPGIARLYDSVRKYADGKKGIVYAVSIEHARNIAGYYNERGLSAVAIDGGTPAGLRKRMVDDFRRGRIRVLVNVDVFSEGFDCPDVGFVQLARPTLSLAKYLQQVGRGLRKTGGKETCVLIDNVGLYRLFGIPTADRDWQAMFEGRLAGKGVPVTGSSGTVAMALARVEHEVVGQDCDLEVVVTHDGLFDILNDGTKGDIRLCVSEPLKAFKDRTAGLYGLRRGNLITVKPEYNDVYDVCDDYAAVKDGNGRVFVIDCNGNKVVEPHCCKKLRLLKGGVAFIVGKNGDDVYIDLKNGKTYHDKPTVVKYGSVEMLRTRHFICSRTKNGCLKIADTDECRFVRCGFYIKVRDYFSEARYRRLDEGYEWWNDGVKCVLENDYDDCYGFCGSLADGSIIVADEKGGYYHVEEGRGKRFVASENPESGADDFDAAVMKLKAEAYRKAAKAECDRQEEREKERRERLAILKDAIPFKSGLKWGLKLGGKVIVPPIYRSLQAPIGDFCAFEAGPYQWGVITLDGRVVVKAMYSKVEIENDGTARLTVIPGKIKTVKLEA